MDKVRFVISLRQASQAARNKLDVMVKPDVVRKEYRASVRELVELFKRYNSKFMDCVYVERLAARSTVFTLSDSADAMTLRIRFLEIERNLPPLLTLTKGKLLK